MRLVEVLRPEVFRAVEPVPPQIELERVELDRRAELPVPVDREVVRPRLVEVERRAVERLVVRRALLVLLLLVLRGEVLLVGI